MIQRENSWEVFSLLFLITFLSFFCSLTNTNCTWEQYEREKKVTNLSRLLIWIKSPCLHSYHRPLEVHSPLVSGTNWWMKQAGRPGRDVPAAPFSRQPSAAWLSAPCPAPHINYPAGSGGTSSKRRMSWKGVGGREEGGRKGREAEAPPFSGGVTVAAACARLRDERWENPRNRRLDVRM